MGEVKKGILTPEQEVKIDAALKFKNPVLELVDGPIIRTVDDVFLEKLANKFEEKYPQYAELFYEVLEAAIESI